MSAFVVQDETINQVVRFLWLHRDPRGGTEPRFLVKQAGYDLNTPEDRERLASAMFALNVEAVNQRYGPDQAQRFRPLDFHYSEGIPTTPVATLKLLGCWFYQCSEGDVPETELYQLMYQVERSIAYQIVTSSAEYDRAPWGH